MRVLVVDTNTALQFQGLSDFSPIKLYGFKEATLDNEVGKLGDMHIVIDYSLEKPELMN